MIVLKLLAWFNWVFQACARFHHEQKLGFLKLKIRALVMWKNWTLTPAWMKSWQHEDSIFVVALNLCLGMAYSLFSNSLSFGGVQNPRYFIFITGILGKMTVCHAVNGWFESSARFFYFITLTCIFFYIICFLYNIQGALNGSVAGISVGKLQDLGSSPRSLTISMLFFMWCFHAVSMIEYHHTSLHQAVHLVSLIHLRVQI